MYNWRLWRQYSRYACQFPAFVIMLSHLLQFNFQVPHVGWHFSSKLCPSDGFTRRSRIVIMLSWETQDRSPLEFYSSTEMFVLTSKNRSSSWVKCAEIPPFTNNSICHIRKGSYCRCWDNTSATTSRQQSHFDLKFCNDYFAWCWDYNKTLTCLV